MVYDFQLYYFVIRKIVLQTVLGMGMGMNVTAQLQHLCRERLVVEQALYEEFARLAETRLAQNTLTYIKLA